tara:strand:+ start:2727 stop:3656 length:930 start_codon:yes stop_codon:yes gene_type:complete
MAFFVPVVYALGGMLIRVAAKKVAEKLAKEGAKKITKKAAEELIEQGTKVTRATTKNVDKVINTAKNMEKGLQGLRDRGGPRGFAQRYQPPTVQLRPSDLKPTPSLGRGIRSGADDFKFAEVIPPKGGKSPKLQGPKIRKDADDAVVGDLTTIGKPPRTGTSPKIDYSNLDRAIRKLGDIVKLETYELQLDDVLPTLKDIKKDLDLSIGSDAEAGEPPDLDTTPDASLQRDDETFDAMGEETEVMESEPSFDSFGEAFSYYRRQKRVPSFMYKGNLYTTRFKEETIPQHKKLFNVTGSYAEDYQSKTGV